MLSRLEGLYLSYNRLESLPPEIQELTRLELLYLEGNPALGLPENILRNPSAPDMILWAYFAE